MRVTDQEWGNLTGLPRFLSLSGTLTTTKTIVHVQKPCQLGLFFSHLLAGKLVSVSVYRRLNIIYLKHGPSKISNTMEEKISCLWYIYISKLSPNVPKQPSLAVKGLTLRHSVMNVADPNPLAIGHFLTKKPFEDCGSFLRTFLMITTGTKRQASLMFPPFRS